MAKKKRKTRGGGRPRAAAASRSAAASMAPGFGPGTLVRDIESYHRELCAKRDEVDAAINAVETALSAMGGAGSRAPSARPTAGRPSGVIYRTGRPGRPKGSGAMRPGSLKVFMVDVLKKTPKAMSPKDIAKAVLKSGYKSKSQNLVRAVSNALPDLKGLKRLGHGQYRL